MQNKNVKTTKLKNQQQSIPLTVQVSNETIRFNSLAEALEQAQAENPKAQYLLHAIYKTGTLDIKRNPEQSNYWCLKSALNGYHHAQYSWGLHLEKIQENLPARNYQEAISWYYAAAQQGNFSACINLAIIYLDLGRVKEAQDFLLQPALAGNSNAEYLLARQLLTINDHSNYACAINQSCYVYKHRDPTSCQMLSH